MADSAATVKTATRQNRHAKPTGGGEKLFQRINVATTNEMLIYVWVILKFIFIMQNKHFGTLP